MMDFDYDALFKADLEALRFEIGNLVKEIVLTSDSAKKANLEDEVIILRSVRKIVCWAMRLLYTIKYDLEEGT